MKCCGYENWETFTVAMELTNNRGQSGLQAARVKLAELEAANEFQYEAAEAFRDWFAESAKLPHDAAVSGDHLLAGIVSGFLDAVNWREVAGDVRGDSEGGES